MKREDLIRAIDTIAPSSALRARVLALPARPRARLENLRPILSLGTAALMCAGVVFAVLALKNMAVPGSDNAGFNALSGGTVTAETTAAPETQAPEATATADNTQSAVLSEVGSPLPKVKQAIPMPEGYIERIAAMQPDAVGEVRDTEQALATAKGIVSGYFNADMERIRWHEPEMRSNDSNEGPYWDVTGENSLNGKDILVYRLGISAKTGAILYAGVIYDFSTPLSWPYTRYTDELNAKWTKMAIDCLNERKLISGATVVKTMLDPNIEYGARIWVILDCGIMVSVDLCDYKGETSVQSVKYRPVWNNPQTPDAPTQTPCPTPNSGSGLDTPSPPR